MSSSVSWSLVWWYAGLVIIARDLGRSSGTVTSAAMREGRLDITATRSARKTASWIEWVTRRVVAGRSAQIRSSSPLSRCG
jgi:hypothetical protein